MAETVKRVILKTQEAGFIPSINCVDDELTEALLNLYDAQLPSEVETQFRSAYLRALEDAPENQIANIKMVSARLRTYR